MVDTTLESAGEVDVGVRALTLSAIKFLATAVATGMYTGTELAGLLVQADVRLYAARVLSGSTDLEFARFVEAADAKAGVSGVFLESVAKFALVHRVISASAVFPSVAGFTDSGWESLAVTRQTQYVAVAGFGGKPLSRAAVDPRKLVVPESVYRAILTIGCSVASDIPAVSVGSSGDGAQVLLPGYDVASSVPVSSITEGKFVLPGGYGALVSAERMRSLLYSILILPALAATDGYCYLRFLPPADRQLAVAILRPFESVSRLVSVFPSALTWTDTEAEVCVVTRGGSVLCHVVAQGTVPRRLIDEGAIAGGIDKRNGMSDSVDPMLDEIFGSLQVGSKKASSSSSSVDTPLDPRALGAGPARGRAVSGLRTPERRESHVRTTSTASRASAGMAGPVRPAWPPDTSSLGLEATSSLVGAQAVLPQAPGTRFVPDATRDDWRVVDDPLVREWSQRLSSGPPLGHNAVTRLSRATVATLPDLPAKDGRTVLVPRADSLGSFPVARWREVGCPLPGWSIFKTKLGADEVVVSPLVPQQVERYELSTDTAVMINGRFMVPGHRTTMWVSGNMSVRVMGKANGSLWRFTTSTGADVVGPSLVGLMRLYGLLTLKEWTGVFTAERVIKLRMASECETRVRYGARAAFASGISRVLLVLLNGTTGSAVLRVSCRSLVRIELYGVAVRADDGVVSVIAGVDSLAVTLHLSANGGECDVFFELVCQPEVRFGYKALPNVVAGQI